MIKELLVQNPDQNPTSDIMEAVALAGNCGETIVSGLHGKYFNQCLAGNVFIAGKSNQTALLRANSLVQNVALWNPKSSTKSMILIKLQVGIVSIANTFTSNFMLAYCNNVSNQIFSGGSGLSLFGQDNIVNGRLGYNKKSVGFFSHSGININAGSSPILIKTFGQSNQINGASAAAENKFWSLTEYYDGDLIIGPDNCLVICSDGLNDNINISVSLTWYEVPV